MKHVGIDYPGQALYAKEERGEQSPNPLPLSDPYLQLGLIMYILYLVFSQLFSGFKKNFPCLQFGSFTQQRRSWF